MLFIDFLFKLVASLLFLLSLFLWLLLIWFLPTYQYNFFPRGWPLAHCYPPLFLSHRDWSDKRMQLGCGPEWCLLGGMLLHLWRVQWLIRIDSQLFSHCCCSGSFRLDEVIRKEAGRVYVIGVDTECVVRLFKSIFLCVAFLYMEKMELCYPYF